MTTPPPSRPASAATRERVVRAVLDCILDKGFYRATSNEIARRAGVSWGVIQHHFGSREALLMAAHRDAGERLEALVEAADVGGSGTQERLTRFWELIDSYYGRPEYLAILQISLNLTRDPAVSTQAIAALVTTNERLEKRLIDLERQAVGPVAPELRPPDGYLFHTLRGLALSHTVLTGTTPQELASRRRPEQRAEHARRLIAALAASLDAATP